MTKVWVLLLLGIVACSVLLGCTNQETTTWMGPGEEAYIDCFFDEYAALLTKVTNRPGKDIVFDAELACVPPRSKVYEKAIDYFECTEAAAALYRAEAKTDLFQVVARSENDPFYERAIVAMESEMDRLTSSVCWPENSLRDLPDVEELKRLQEGSVVTTATLEPTSVPVAIPRSAPEPTAAAVPPATKVLAHPDLQDPGRIIKVGALDNGPTFWSDGDAFLLLGCYIDVDTPTGEYLFSHRPWPNIQSRTDVIILGQFPGDEPLQGNCYSMLVKYEGIKDYCKTSSVIGPHCADLSIRRFSMATKIDWAQRIPLKRVQRFTVPDREDR